MAQMETVFKEMVYGDYIDSINKEHEVIASGTYNGYDYLIINRITHPCAYIRIPEGHELFQNTDIDEFYVDCHGGVTFCDNGDHFGRDASEKWFGWDYGHLGDFFDNGIISIGQGKKWTTQEILDEVKDVINTL